MQLFKLNTQISRFESFADFSRAFQLCDQDLIITNAFLYDPFMRQLNLPCHVIFQENFGQGEPTDIMINAMLKHASILSFNRVIAVGGGTVIDVAKLFVLNNVEDVVQAFERKIPLLKQKQLVVVPTTCGTGSEVTNITIAELTTKQTKMGLADDTLLPDHAVLIPEFLKGLPFRFYAASAIDALIHAVEAYVSPKANGYTKLFSQAAIEIILRVFEGIAAKGQDYRLESLEEMLMASNFAGIAFGNAGVGAVHALSYPLGGNYHVPHGEANYQLFTAVFRKYKEKKPVGAIQQLNQILAGLLSVSEEQVYDKLDELLGVMMEKQPLRDYGMQPAECQEFADSVLEKQTRLLANNYEPLTRDEIIGIFQSLY